MPEDAQVEMGRTCSRSGPTEVNLRFYKVPRIGKRDLGRPKTRCSDIFKKTIGGQWTLEARIWSSCRNIPRRIQQEAEYLHVQG